jgi:hypothetical protein
MSGNDVTAPLLVLGSAIIDATDIFVTAVIRLGPVTIVMPETATIGIDHGLTARTRRQHDQIIEQLMGESMTTESHSLSVSTPSPKPHTTTNMFSNDHQVRIVEAIALNRRVTERGTNPLVVTKPLYKYPGTTIARFLATPSRPAEATDSTDVQAKSGNVASYSLVLLRCWNSVFVKPGHSALT